MLLTCCLSCKESNEFHVSSFIQAESSPQPSHNKDFWNQGVLAYNKGDYSIAFQYWDRLSFENNTRDTLIFYKAIASSQLENWDIAIQHLNRISFKSPFYERALLYKSLNYYMKGDTKQYQRLLDQVKDKDLPLYNIAKNVKS